MKWKDTMTLLKSAFIVQQCLLSLDDPSTRGIHNSVYTNCHFIWSKHQTQCQQSPDDPETSCLADRSRQSKIHEPRNIDGSWFNSSRKTISGSEWQELLSTVILKISAGKVTKVFSGKWLKKLIIILTRYGSCLAKSDETIEKQVLGRDRTITEGTTGQRQQKKWRKWKPLPSN